MTEDIEIDEYDINSIDNEENARKSEFKSLYNYMKSNEPSCFYLLSKLFDENDPIEDSKFITEKFTLLSNSLITSANNFGYETACDKLDDNPDMIKSETDIIIEEIRKSDYSFATKNAFDILVNEFGEDKNVMNMFISLKKKIQKSIIAGATEAIENTFANELTI